MSSASSLSPRSIRIAPEVRSLVVAYTRLMRSRNELESARTVAVIVLLRSLFLVGFPAGKLTLHIVKKFSEGIAYCSNESEHRGHDDTT